MNRNIIVTGAAGNLGKSVVEKFKREGFRVIATVHPGKLEEMEEADDVYELDVTDEQAVAEFAKEYAVQYGGELDAMVLLVGGFAMGDIENTSKEDIEKMFQLNFFSAYNMSKAFLPVFKKAGKGSILFVGARPALQPADGKSLVAYTLSKGLVLNLAELVSEEGKDAGVKSHVFVPSIIDTPPNREAMPDQDYSKWVSPAEIAEAMHFAVSNPSLKNTTFKLYGGV
ncbi:SDR family NAD(P)-dependent oxidoreductase [Echinicola marina]|uniref:SDR family NAD(P)-dependent oxidoreductase n=1 Tax=Echinicola marina TaxID=2859768 RepID=UPI001CF6BC77|nr:SDR family NAD(P)-dependent oxidoreductase [Echinicola marina]UCS95306.1 SDR family NAD(P)-dependent oxidoreductase [Echinicola marina]